jgi:hypothetical protein
MTNEAPTQDNKAQDPWAPAPEADDYDRSIHSNPDPAAWAAFFVRTFPGLKDKEDLMLGWFANAMIAMHDHLKPQLAVPVAEQQPVAYGSGDGYWVRAVDFPLRPDKWRFTEKFYAAPEAGESKL